MQGRWLSASTPSVGRLGRRRSVWQAMMPAAEAYWRHAAPPTPMGFHDSPPPARRLHPGPLGGDVSRAAGGRELFLRKQLAFTKSAASSRRRWIHFWAMMSVWQNPFVERFIGSARRECFDHVIVFNDAGVLRLMARYRS
jgi:hypothetical protein